MKKWEKPSISNLEFETTQTSEGCLYEDELKGTAQPTTLFPVIIWGDGKVGCTYWDSKKHGCTNSNYGSKWNIWPCPKAAQSPELS